MMTTPTTTLYKKVGRKYIAIGEYSPEFMDRLPYGAHLCIVKEGSNSRTYNINPDFASLIAAGKYAKDDMTNAIWKASEARPQQRQLTDEQFDLWDKLKKSLGDEMFYIQYQSAHAIAESGVSAMQEEANKMLQHPSVKSAWDHFMLTWMLAKEQNEQS